MKSITKNQFVELMDTNKGTEMISIHIATDPKMRKTDNPYLGTVKFQTLSGIAGYDYANSVNAQLIREGKEASFVAEPRTWGVRISPKWVMHNEERYLTLKVQGHSTPSFFLNDKEIEFETLKPFIPEKKSPSTQAELEKKVKHTEIKLSNIISITMKGDTFMIVD